MNYTPIVLMSKAAATGAGDVVAFGKPVSSFGIEIEWTVTGTGADKAVTALVVALEGSITGTTYEALDTAITLSGGQLTAKYALSRIIDKPCAFIRANPTTVTITGSTGTVTLTIKILPID